MIEVEPQRSGGAPTRPEHYDEYSHVVVDESQDLSPMQWRMVGRRGKYASWTVVGDPVQSSWPDPAEAAQARDQAFGVTPARRRFTLRANYRTSAEIFDLAAKVGAGHAEAGELPVAVRKTGVEPEVRPGEAAGLASATQAAVKELLGAVEGTVGVITAMDRVPEVAGWVSGQADERLKVVGSEDSKGQVFVVV